MQPFKEIHHSIHHVLQQYSNYPIEIKNGRNAFLQKIIWGYNQKIKDFDQRIVSIAQIIKKVKMTSQECHDAEGVRLLTNLEKELRSLTVIVLDKKDVSKCGIKEIQWQLYQYIIKPKEPFLESLSEALIQFRKNSSTDNLKNILDIIQRIKREKPGLLDHVAQVFINHIQKKGNSLPLLMMLANQPHYANISLDLILPLFHKLTHLNCKNMLNTLTPLSRKIKDRLFVFLLTTLISSIPSERLDIHFFARLKDCISEREMMSFLLQQVTSNSASIKFFDSALQEAAVFLRRLVLEPLILHSPAHSLICSTVTIRLVEVGTVENAGLVLMDLFNLVISPKYSKRILEKIKISLPNDERALFRMLLENLPSSMIKALLQLSLIVIDARNINKDALIAFTQFLLHFGFESNKSITPVCHFLYNFIIKKNGKPTVQPINNYLVNRLKEGSNQNNIAYLSFLTCCHLNLGLLALKHYQRTKQTEEFSEKLITLLIRKIKAGTLKAFQEVLAFFEHIGSENKRQELKASLAIAIFPHESRQIPNIINIKNSEECCRFLHLVVHHKIEHDSHWLPRLEQRLRSAESQQEALSLCIQALITDPILQNLILSSYKSPDNAKDQSSLYATICSSIIAHDNRPSAGDYSYLRLIESNMVRFRLLQDLLYDIRLFNEDSPFNFEDIKTSREYLDFLLRPSYVSEKTKKAAECLISRFRQDLLMDPKYLRRFLVCMTPSQYSRHHATEIQMEVLKALDQEDFEKVFSKIFP